MKLTTETDREDGVRRFAGVLNHRACLLMA
jgi:hypothetical protein